MKILFLSPNQSHKYNPGNQHFRDEVARQHKVVFVGPGWGKWKKDENKKVSVLPLVKYHKDIDCIMTYGMKYTVQYFRDLFRVKVPKVHFQDDIFPSMPGFIGTIPQYRQHLMRVNYDVVFCRTTRAMNIVKEVCDKVFLLPHGVNVKYFTPKPTHKDIDVSAPMSYAGVVYPNRRRVHDVIRKMPVTSITKRVFNDEYIQTIRRSKIFVNSVCHWKSFNFKFTEVPACGTFLLTDKSRDFNNLGFIDGQHMVLYDGPKELEEKINYYLENENEREVIAAKGMHFVRECHSFKARVESMTTVLEAVL